MSLKQGNTTLAKEKMKECLSISNGSLSHNQLTSTSLNVLGTTLLEEDVMSMDQLNTSTLLKSSLVLAYRSEDFFPKFIALNSLDLAYKKNNERSNQSYNLGYKVGMERELRQAIDEARSSPLTITLLTNYILVGEVRGSGSGCGGGRGICTLECYSTNVLQNEDVVMKSRGKLEPTPSNTNQSTPSSWVLC
eukprot:TRINITY_DN6761_c0_g1_i13.p2 TRINITY_DN6761_c0_g1~~TRINITY_DN6761_c0_g1_i13.p2  ORF type:complete len:192 (-),score=44.14 TRINITY_DN6761_c0_g1_i13:140-715(-)